MILDPRNFSSPAGGFLAGPFRVPDEVLQAALAGMRLDRCLFDPQEIAGGGEETRALMERIAGHLSEVCPPVGHAG